MNRDMRQAEVRSGLLAIAGLLAALMTMPAMQAQAGSENRITDPGSSAAAPAAAPASSEPAKSKSARKPAPSREAKHPEKRKHAEHAEPERRTVKSSTPRTRQETQPAAEAAPAARPLGISIGVGGMSIGF
jgi:hypothetical protein